MLIDELINILQPNPLRQTYAECPEKPYQVTLPAIYIIYSEWQIQKEAENETSHNLERKLPDKGFWIFRNHRVFVYSISVSKVKI
jgi:hypothetical protein